MSVELYHGDCLEVTKDIPGGSVDLILTDLPYGTMQGIADGDTSWSRTNTEWDSAIPPSDIYAVANRVLRKNGKMVLFSQEPYTSQLINEAIPNVPFSYRMIWEKDIYGNALFAKKAPLIFFEDILVFSKMHETTEEDLFADYRNWLTNRMESSGATWRDEEIHQKYVEEGVAKNIQSARVIAKHKMDMTYNQLERINEKHYKILEEFIDFDKTPKEVDELYDRSREGIQSTFNLWEGNKYKSNILKYRKDYDGYHPTQKPISLLADLIKTFSNEGDLVVDLTMGSGSTGVACKNTGRRFIGIEMDDEYFNIAKERIETHEKQLSLV